MPAVVHSESALAKAHGWLMAARPIIAPAQPADAARACTTDSRKGGAERLAIVATRAACFALI
eukprot:scaffold7909_cov36-Tisochrysis_lutea.AAC.2